MQSSEKDCVVMEGIDPIFASFVFSTVNLPRLPDGVIEKGQIQEVNFFAPIQWSP